jgi:hypothetical protein
MQHEWDRVEGPLWLHLLGWADRQIEKQFIEKEYCAEEKRD